MNQACTKWKTAASNELKTNFDRVMFANTIEAGIGCCNQEWKWGSNGCIIGENFSTFIGGDIGDVGSKMMSSSFTGELGFT